MKYNRLGTSDLMVSELGLGTMTYGEQNTATESRALLDEAIAQGINFIDTAELYPMPARVETHGDSETIIGDWLTQQKRDQLIISTKVMGPNAPFTWLEGTERRLDRATIVQAVDGSLQRLQTDYIDLYYIHWPDRYVPLFGQTDYDPSQVRPTVAIAEQLLVFADLITAGKIRYLGLSNETPWGINEFCRLAQQLDLPQVVSLQNAYNLTNRVFETHLAETCYHQNVGLIAYCPLAFGYLTGKYQRGIKATGRITQFPGFGQRYTKTNFLGAIQAYGELAAQYQLNAAQMALAFVRSRWFVSSTLIGATRLEQLTANCGSLELDLSPEVLAAIETVHQRFPNPAP
ncbi:MAG: NADP(H)-dependent aldo-keto reductase [Spirulina sp. SIO3F2]|nr:NADP(H)-dependent aldo-keto reductase [Spirulina sp. SIO3F2]